MSYLKSVGHETYELPATQRGSIVQGIAVDRFGEDIIVTANNDLRKAGGVAGLWNEGNIILFNKTLPWAHQHNNNNFEEKVQLFCWAKNNYGIGISAENSIYKFES